MTALLQASGISKRFGGLLAIDNVSLLLPRASIHAVIGPNGAGKTTLFNCLTSFVKPSSGEVYLDGVRIDGLRPDLVAAQGIARTYQNIRLFPDLTALENIMVGVDAKRPERPPRHRPRHQRPRERAAGSARACRAGRPPGPAPAVRRPAPAGDRPRHGHRPGAAAAG